MKVRNFSGWAEVYHFHILYCRGQGKWSPPVQFLPLMKVHNLASWTEVYYFHMLFMKTLLQKTSKVFKSLLQKSVRSTGKVKPSRTILATHGGLQLGQLDTVLSILHPLQRLYCRRQLGRESEALQYNSFHSWRSTTWPVGQRFITFTLFMKTLLQKASWRLCCIEGR